MKRSIWEIILVRHKDGEILLDTKICADSSEHAVVKAKIGEICEKEGLKLSQTETLIMNLGELRNINEVNFVKEEITY